ncbi:MAG: hypothetical protein HOH88_03875, partial [Flavobacteriales bacterium]|nr:hypothetical protein [Flavobacteriales bacterium]
MKIVKLGLLVLLLNSCGLSKMSSDYHKVKYEQTPAVLEVHGGYVIVDLEGTFPSQYFAKKATVEITPVIISENGEESTLKSIILQGEQATGGEHTIFFESGGEFVYEDKIEYTDAMKSSKLELRAVAILEDDNKVLGPITIAEGVISTSQRVANTEIIAVADHGYKEIEVVSETATIYFLVNKSNIRTTEKSDDDVKKLQEFIKQGYKTQSFVVKSSASPEGTEKINTELSDDRKNSTLTYAKDLLKKLKADGSNDDENYTLSSAGADWTGFNKLVENSSIVEKNTILSLTDRNKKKSQKEKGELLQDMAEVYDALEGDVLQYLRKSEITINSYLPKKTKTEIMNHAFNIKILSSDGSGLIDNSDLYTPNLPYKLVTFTLKDDPLENLDVNEALYAAYLVKDSSSFEYEDLLLFIAENLNDWRAWNNLAVLKMQTDREDPITMGAESKETLRFIHWNDSLTMAYLQKAIENGGANEPE